MADLSDLAAPGGAVQPDDPFYIERASDYVIRAVARRLEETVIIKAPRQLGKSTLLQRYLAECRRAGKKTALIDLSLFANPDLADYPTFLTTLATLLLKRFRPGSQFPTIVSQSDMSDFVQDFVLRAVPDNIVIAFDEADRVLGRPYQSDFFSMLRYWQEQRTDPGQRVMARLELTLVISTEPYLLIADVHRSPFNIGTQVRLSPFDIKQCRELNRRYDDFLTDGQASACGNC